jgi:hypothetical protein
MSMNAVLDPLISEFDTEEQAASYDRWLLAKVQKAQESKKPLVPHDQVMAEARALIEQKRKKYAAG